MKVALLAPKPPVSVLKRLESLRVTIQLQDTKSIHALGGHSADLVYFVPFSALGAKGWAETRVKLAQSGRYYIVFGSGLGSAEIMRAAHDGAHDVLNEEDSDARWEGALEASVEAQKLWCQLYGGQQTSRQWQNLIGRSHAMQAIRDSIKRIGPTDAAVLVMGESGTGKERIAEAIHVASGREPFVPVNCAAIPADLLESEFFGAEKGAYTGADRAKVGLVEEASGGTLFLDEIGEMSMSLQPKILRFLETGVARRVGSTKEYTCNARVISATNRDLKIAAKEGRFRMDLYYRLSEVVLQAPPLRQRLDDIPDLANFFLKGAAERMGKHFDQFEPELIYKLKLYDWPGNVRELKQVIERLAIHYDGPMMRADWWDVPEERPAARSFAAAEDGSEMLAPVRGGGNVLPTRKGKQAVARQLLTDHGDDLAWVAAQVGVHPTTLYRWRKAGIV